jgi:hypothetical protein
MSLAKGIRKRLATPEEKKGFTDFVKERPLDLTLRRLTRKVAAGHRTRKASKQ